MSGVQLDSDCDPDSDSDSYPTAVTISPVTANGFQNLPVVRKSSQSALREHQFAVDRDLEDPVLALYQLNRGCKLALQLGRQPGSPRLIISNNAVLDRNVHAHLHARES
jgi:hypothetical protein